jgi:hypothetical protein
MYLFHDTESTVLCCVEQYILGLLWCEFLGICEDMFLDNPKRERRKLRKTSTSMVGLRQVFEICASRIRDETLPYYGLSLCTDWITWKY